MEVSWNRATPNSHPFLDGIFPCKPSSYWGTPHDNGNSHWLLSLYHKQHREAHLFRRLGPAEDLRHVRVAALHMVAVRRQVGGHEAQGGAAHLGTGDAPRSWWFNQPT